MAIRKFTMVNADNTTKEEAERSESMRHFVVNRYKKAESSHVETHISNKNSEDVGSREYLI
jgi:hypothetical protein